MKYQIKVFSIWEFGQRKDSQGNPHQEDSLFPEFGKQTENDRLFILCDGMGGHDAGEVASATVCKAMSSSIIVGGEGVEGEFSSADFDKALNEAFDALDEKDNGAEKKMGTTMTFLKLHNHGAYIAHMGDSRVYHIRPGKSGEDTQILYETRDHSLINDLIKAEVMTKEEAIHSNQKNVITRAMQPNMSRQPKAEIYETVDIKPGDYFYLCSDGMLEQPEMEEGISIKNIFSELGGSDENKVDILKSVTEQNCDNHSAFIIHVIDVIDPIEEKNHCLVNTEPLQADKFTAIVEESEEDVSNVKDQLEKAEKKRPKIYSYPPKNKVFLGILATFFIAVIAIVYGMKSCSRGEAKHSDDSVEQLTTTYNVNTVGGTDALESATEHVSTSSLPVRQDSPTTSVDTTGCLSVAFQPQQTLSLTALQIKPKNEGGIILSDEQLVRDNLK